MRFDAIRIHQLGPFADVDLDFSQTDARLIAVTGDNGAGKSTLLELLPAALYRSCPTRGSLVDLAMARDARLEVRVQNGSPITYTIVQRADNVSRKSTGQVITDKGDTLIDTAKVSDVDRFVGAHFPAADVLYASAFLAQGSEGFVKLAPAERKRVLLRILQIERLEALAERARSHERNARALVVTANARLQDVQSQYPDFDAATAAHAAACARADDAKAAVKQAERVVQDARAAAAAAAVRLEQYALRHQLQHKAETVAHEVADLQERIRNNKALIARSADIQLAVKQEQDHATREAELREALAEAQAKTARLEARTEAAQQHRVRCEQQQAATATRLAGLRAQVEAAQAAQGHSDKLPLLQQNLRLRQGKRDALDQAISDSEAQRSQGLMLRVGQLREGLTCIAQGSAAKKNTQLAAQRIATATLAQDDEQIERDAAAPAKLRVLRVQLDKARQDADAALKQLDEARELAQSARAHGRLAAELTTLTAEHAQLLADAEAAEQRAVAVSQELKQARAAAARLTQERDAAVTARRACAPTLALAPKLAQAETRLQELEPQLVRLASEHQALLDQIGALPRPSASERSPELLLADVGAAERALAEVTRAADAVERANQGRALLAERRSELTAAEASARDYGRLGRDLGKDGLQAMEIDAALPELQALANDLLHSCHGTRFTLQLSTTALSSDGKRTLEALDIRVIDTEHGRDDLVETYSGGERVIIGEALSLALTMIACRAAGLERPTLVRDESGAALDPDNGRAYVAMLRRAADLLRADKVFYVSHTPELQELADARIVVANGHATLHA